MDELYLQWEDAVANGETEEEFEDWFSGRADFINDIED